MRLKITLSCRNRFVIPVNYNHYIQGLIYQHLPTQLSNEIHNEGFQLGGRKFKLFSFSQLFVENGYFDFNRHVKVLATSKMISFYLSSAVEEILHGFASSMARENLIKLGSNLLEISAIEVIKKPNLSNQITYKTLSPITMYSTLLTPDNRKKTYYYNPFEEEFSKLIHRNLLKKLKLLNPENGEYIDRLAEEPFKIEMLKTGKYPEEKIIKYKGFVIRAYSGLLKLRSDPILHEIAYDTGLGSKNSQGFGLIDIYERNNYASSN